MVFIGDVGMSCTATCAQFALACHEPAGWATDKQCVERQTNAHYGGPCLRASQIGVGCVGLPSRFMALA